MLLRETVSPEDAELILQVFKTLRPNQSTSPRHFLDDEYQRHEREWKQAHDQTKVEQAFHSLTLLGFAKQVSDGYYDLLDPKATANVVMRRVLQHVYNETKKGLNDFRRREFYGDTVSRIAFGFLVASALVLPLLFGSAAPYWLHITVIFIALYLGSSLLKNWSSRLWNRCKLSNEKKIAVMLVDAHDSYVNADRDQTAKAVETARKASKILREASATTRWNALAQERVKLTEIGEDIDSRVLPAMVDKKGNKAKIAEILIHLACLFFQDPPENVKRIPEVYQRLPVAAKTETPAPIPISTRLRKDIAYPKTRTVIAIMLSAVITYVVIYLGTAMTNVTFPPTPANLLAALLAIAGVTTLVRHLLPQ